MWTCIFFVIGLFPFLEIKHAKNIKSYRVRYYVAFMALRWLLWFRLFSSFTFHASWPFECDSAVLADFNLSNALFSLPQSVLTSTGWPSQGEWPVSRCQHWKTHGQNKHRGYEYITNCHETEWPFIQPYRAVSSTDNAVSLGRSKNSN